MKYVAHVQETGKQQSVQEHLKGVAKLAAKNAQSFGNEDMAYQIGLAHDIGKYSKEFQRRILQNGPKVDHSTAGAKEIEKHNGMIAAYAVMGHHTGLPNGGSAAHATGGEGTYFGRMQKQSLPDYSAFANEIELEQAQPQMKTLEATGYSVAFYIRMLFSALVDADYLDTEYFMKDGTVARGEYDSMNVLYERYKKYIQMFDDPKTPINKKRNEILQDCLQSAEKKQGLYTLTVPTGGGKTIASLGFALKHAMKYGMDRVIYVIPYTSIIEQNAKAIASIVGEHNVLEHHSNVTYDNQDAQQNKKYLATENWDMPVIVTTNVQFFESLYANRNSPCRKLHNITNSVVIFDEAQVLPQGYMHPSFRGIAELVHGYHTTAIICTATQPYTQYVIPKEVDSKEIVQDPPALYTFFQRSRVEDIGKLSDAELAERLQSHKQALCIVNTRKQAQNLFDAVDGAEHLSTLLYPVHRLRKLEYIREALKQDKECRVVSTSLIEAGVDLDFPVVYRAETGLDSIIQAAGRCNREGKRSKDESMVYVFKEDEGYALPLAFQQPAALYRSISRQHKEVDSLAAIRAYFKLLMDINKEALDEHKIVQRLEDAWNKRGGSFPFKDVAQEFQLIEDHTYPVLILIEEKAQEFEQRLRGGEWSYTLLKELGKYSVNVYKNHLQHLLSKGMVEAVGKQSAHAMEEYVFILTDMSVYDADKGLALAPDTGRGIFQ